MNDKSFDVGTFDHNQKLELPRKLSESELNKLVVDMEHRALKAESKLSNLELVVICAKDIVEAWPKMTMRTLGTMTKSIDTLHQALESAGK